eukprot:gnl/MRDRNA2_/MRDRNA2_88264_c0_seq1.p1 gnl/MRDRNA2_/MRDRNA2_88264_c0~~gnl/MRDRNA2_/MRDRNA2_88264_c0_seq1.p1  ORF type:complete len:307 (+),score=41.32 gnl/MRDRNA2_/MRDRNA2_88264_c0_seq1:69-989(+)
MALCRGFLGEADFWSLEGDAPILKFDHGWLQQHSEEAVAHARRWIAALGITESKMEVDTTPIVENDQNRIFRADANRTFRAEKHKVVYIKLLSFAQKKFGDYQQSLGYVAGVLCLIFDPATVFKVLTVLNDNPKFLCGYWRGEATLCAVDGYVAMELCPNQAMMTHVRGLGLLPETFVQKWFAGVCIHHLPYKLLFPYLDAFFDHGNEFLFAWFSAFFEEFESTLQNIKTTAEANELVRLESAPHAQLEIVTAKAAQRAPNFLSGRDLHAIRCRCFDTYLSKRLQSANEGMWQIADDDITFSDEED